jgi:hypothetical protein
MHQRKLFFCLVAIGIFLSGCQQTGKPTTAAGSLLGVPAQRLSYTFDSDTIPPVEPEQTNTAEDRIATVQADFDQNRPQELLDKTIPSPDKQRVLAIFHRAGDGQTEFRLDMYGADGKLVNHITPDAMAISLPDAIAWAPDGSVAAFIGVARRQPEGAAPPSAADAPTPPEVGTEDANANIDANNPAANSNAVNANANTAATPPPVSAPIRLFANEQIYTCNKDGVDLKYISQKDTLIYFDLLWSPDSKMMITLATSPIEWKYGEMFSASKGMKFTPSGRPRLIDKAGRERLLDDNPTAVVPVWSPDSSKVACAFGTDVKIYDAVGDLPTIAAIPLRLPLLESSQRFDQLLHEEMQSGNTNGNSNAAGNAPVPAPTIATPANVKIMPKESDLVSFNPVVELRWVDEKTVYLKTGYIKEMLDSRFSSFSYMRWHKLNLNTQAATK